MQLRFFPFVVFLLIMGITCFTSCDTVPQEISFGQDKVLFTHPVTQVVAQRLGEYLENDGFFKNEGTKVKVSLSNDTFQVYLPVDTTILPDPAFLSWCQGNTIRWSWEVFEGKPATLVLADADFQAKQWITGGPPPELAKTFKRDKFEGNSFYYPPGIQGKIVNKVIDFLKQDSTFAPESGAVALLDSTSSGWIFGYVAHPEVIQDAEYRKHVQNFRTKMQNACFQTESLSVRIYDSSFKGIETFTQ